MLEGFVKQVGFKPGVALNREGVMDDEFRGKWSGTPARLEF